MLKYFKGTMISTLSISPSSSVWPVILVSKLNESVALAPLKLTISRLLFTAGLSLQYYHKLPDVFEELSLYSIKLYIGITISISLASSICILFISFMQLVNGAHF